jgi:single-stranded-DNA-specific exonuclease
VGVAFYLMLALRTLLRDKGWFESRGIAVPNLAEYLDLVALGTVADVVPLDTNNRILTWQGLSRIRAGKCRPGIKRCWKLPTATRSSWRQAIWALPSGRV